VGPGAEEQQDNGRPAPEAGEGAPDARRTVDGRQQQMEEGDELALGEGQAGALLQDAAAGTAQHSRMIVPYSNILYGSYGEVVIDGVYIS
jgi:hypothetical protein